MKKNMMYGEMTMKMKYETPAVEMRLVMLEQDIVAGSEDIGNAGGGNAGIGSVFPLDDDYGQ